MLVVGAQSVQTSAHAEGRDHQKQQEDQNTHPGAFRL
jgi:hypothetical protein